MRRALRAMLALLLAATGSLLVVAATPVGLGLAEPEPAVTTDAMATVHQEPGHNHRGKLSFDWLPGEAHVSAAWVDQGTGEETDDRRSLRVRLVGPDGDTALWFGAAAGESLTTRTYARARERALDGPEAPPSVRLGDGCWSYGSFTVHELAPDLGRVWITFETACIWSPSRTFGEVRIGMPEPAGPPTSTSAVAWPGQAVGTSAGAVAVLARNDTDETARINATLGPGPDAFTILGDDCDSVAPGAWCRVHVRFRPVEPGTWRRELRVTGPSGTTGVALSGEGWGGVTAYGSWTGRQRPKVSALDADIPVLGDRNTVFFAVEAHPAFPDFWGYFHTAAGIEAGKTYGGDDGYLDLIGGAWGHCPGQPDAVHVHEATFGPGGDLTSIAITWRRCEGTGVISWRAEQDRPAPALTETEPLGAPQVQVVPTTGSAVLTWGFPQAYDPARGAVIVRRVTPGRPVEVRRLTTSTHRALDLGPLKQGHDYDVSLALLGPDGPSKPSVTLVRGTRLELDQPLLRKGRTVVRGRLTDLRGRPVHAQYVHLTITPAKGPAVTVRRFVGSGGFSYPMRARVGDRISATYTCSGPSSPMLGSASGAVTVRAAPRR